jgi:DHA1 family inner membrane transport protein
VKRDEEAANLRAELGALRNLRLWVGIGMTVLFSASMFTLFTYIAPLLNTVTGISPRGVTWTLLLVGVGLTVGNTLGGLLADWRMLPALSGSLAVMALLEMLYFWAGRSVLSAEITLVIWGAACFAAAVCLQMNVITTGSAAPNLAATLNVGAFNAGNALGAWLGGLVIAHGPGLAAIPLIGALPAVLALAITLGNIFVFKAPATLASADASCAA